MPDAKYTSPSPASVVHLCPERPSEIGIEIPGDAWWPGQRESIGLILHAFWAGQKYVIAAIPTGGGKTIIAAAVQKILGHESGATGGTSLALTHCLDGDTPVLMEDLSWRAIRDVRVGERVVAFDAEPIPSNGWKSPRRKMRNATVLGTCQHDVMRRRLITTDRGSVIASAEHPWLVMNNCRRLVWKRTADIALGDQIKYLTSPTQRIDSWEAGFISAAFDGEGHVRCRVANGRGGSHLVFCQKDNAMLAEVRRILPLFGFTYTERIGQRDVVILKLGGGVPEIIRFIATFRPPRLMKLLEQPANGLAGFDPQRAEKATVVEVQEIGAGRVYNIETDAQTFIANGFFSHNTIQLQEQYVRTLTNARVITGRGNHACELPPDHPAKALDPNLTAADAPCSAGEGCPISLNRRGGCAYYKQWWNAADAPMTVMNYAYAARILQIRSFIEKKDDSDGDGDSVTETIPNPFRRDLLVMDECHLAHDVLVEAAGRTIWMKALREIPAVMESLPALHTRVTVTEGGPRSQKEVQYENVALWIAWADQAHKIVKEQQAAARKGLEGLKARAQEEKGSPEERAAVKAWRTASTNVKGLEELRDSLAVIAKIENADEWIIRRNYGRDNRMISITAQPIWGTNVIPQMIFQHFNRILLMSATPGDPDVARTILGIPTDQSVYIERPSTFPTANRPVFYYPVAKLNYKSGDLEWDKITRAIYTIASNPQNVQRKGLVHSGSAANAKRLVTALNARFGYTRAFTHGEGHEHTRESALEEFTKSTDPRILVTASFTTGLDLPYVIGWQVIAKVPYGNLADELTSRRRAFKLADGRSFGQTYYAAQSMNVVVQAAGRIVRSPTDTGPTFILDSAYAMLHASAFKPQSYLDAFRRIEVAKGG